MDKKEYFSQLLKLYEAVDPVDATQTAIADKGSDLKDPKVDKEEVPEQTAQEISSDNELDDAAYLNPMMGPASNDASEVSSESKKLMKLFDLFENLLTYSEMYTDTLDSIDVSLLDSNVYSVSKYRAALSDISKKIRDYIETTFKNEVYERALYAYIMLRTELLTAIESLRKILKLNEVDENDKK